MCMYVLLCVYHCVCIAVCVCIIVCMYVLLCVCVCVYHCVCTIVCVCVLLSLCFSLCVCVHRCVCALPLSLYLCRSLLLLLLRHCRLDFSLLLKLFLTKKKKEYLSILFYISSRFNTTAPTMSSPIM